MTGSTLSSENTKRMLSFSLLVNLKKKSLGIWILEVLNSEIEQQLLHSQILELLMSYMTSAHP